MTSDRCWDLSLVLEGDVQRATQPENRPLCNLQKLLPDWAVSSLKASRRKQLIELADDLQRTKLAPPPDWQEVKFHVMGLKQTPWRPGPADEIALISPFLTDTAVAQVCGNAKQRVSLISRPDTLSALNAETRASFEACYVLDEAAETEDGEDPSGGIGRHCRLKSRCLTACRFESGFGYQISRIATSFGHGVACAGRPGPVDHKARNYAVQQLQSPPIGGVEAGSTAIDAVPQTR